VFAHNNPWLHFSRSASPKDYTGWAKGHKAHREKLNPFAFYRRKQLFTQQHILFLRETGKKKNAIFCLTSTIFGTQDRGVEIENNRDSAILTSASFLSNTFVKRMKIYTYLK